MKSITHLTKHIRLNVVIYGEKRGISYGMYNQKNVVVYPIILLELKDTLTLFKHRFAVGGKVGDFLNENWMRVCSFTTWMCKVAEEQ